MIFKIITLLCLFYCTDQTVAEVDCSKPPPPWAHIGDCCAVSLPVSDEVKDLCIEKISKDSNIGVPGPPKFKCLYECVLNETGIWDYETKSLVADKLDKFLNNAYDNMTDLKPVAKEAFEFCAEKHNERSQMNHTEVMHHRCRMNLIHCVKMQVFKNCPDSIWSATTECNETREHMQNCKPMPGGPRGPHGPHGPPPPPPPSVEEADETV